MVDTTFSRKLDTSGRIMIPIKLREQMGLVIGQEYYFFTHEENGKKYIAIECGNIPKTPSISLEEALKVVQQHGLKLVQNDN